MSNLNIVNSNAPKQALPTVSASTVAELTPLPSVSGSTVGQTAPTPTQTSKAVLADAKTKMAPRKAESSLTREAALNDAGLSPSPALAKRNRELIRQSRWPFESFVVIDGQVRWR